MYIFTIMSTKYQRVYNLEFISFEILSFHKSSTEEYKSSSLCCDLLLYKLKRCQINTCILKFLQLNKDEIALKKRLTPCSGNKPATLMKSMICMVNVR